MILSENGGSNLSRIEYIMLFQLQTMYVISPICSPASSSVTPYQRSRGARFGRDLQTAAVNFAEDLFDFAGPGLGLVAFNEAQKLWKSAAGEPGKSGRSHW